MNKQDDFTWLTDDTEVHMEGPELIQVFNPLQLTFPGPAELERAQIAMQEVLEHLGYDTDSEHMEETALRYVKMMKQMSFDTEVPSNFTTFAVPEGKDGGIILQRNVQFSSMCAHHLCPFEGIAHIAYIPTDRMVGLSKLARVLIECAQGPNVQEEIGMRCADFLEEHLKPMAVAVVIQATHTCMTMRGVKAHGSETITTQMRGAFFNDPRARAEVMSLLTL